MDDGARAVHDSDMSRERSNLATFAPVIDLRVARVLRALRADPGRAWRVRELTKIAGASRASLSRLFRATFGVSPKRWLTTLRLEEAARLLVGQQEPVAEVALRVGYQSVFSFSRAFKRKYGASPVHYRRHAGLSLRCAA